MSEEFILADNVKVYDLKTAKEIISKTKKDVRSLSAEDLIFVLFYSQKENPIYGRTMLTKQMFLLVNEILSETSIKFQDVKFVPYSYGPYSFYLMDTINHLNFSGDLIIDGRKNSSKESFILTARGIDNAKKVYDSLPKNIRDIISNKRIGWDQLGTKGILRYVYNYYPAFKQNSKIKNKFKEITWGKGKG